METTNEKKIEILQALIDETTFTPVRDMPVKQRIAYRAYLNLMT